MKINLIAEIGINHNGSLDIATRLIDMASIAGFDYVKFQKRDPDICVPEDQKNKIKDTPWGKMTYLEYKKMTEFNAEQYSLLKKHCDKMNIKIMFSVWDISSAKFVKALFGGEIIKIPSAKIIDKDLLIYCASNFCKIILSTGMSTEKEIEEAVRICNPNVIMHTNSSYPTPMEEMNLNYISYLRKKYIDYEIGYSGHEFGLSTTFAVATMGISWIERHVTLDRAMWGSDHFASVEPVGMLKLVKGIRDIEIAFGKESVKGRIVTESEKIKLESLRGNK